jgi:putative toxin-antitoxin system antitoxin component (TIGR02293 family)
MTETGSEPSVLSEATRLLGGAKVLHGPVKSELGVHRIIQRGVPALALLALLSQVTLLADKDVLRAIGISERTVARHKVNSQQRLDVDQGGRLWSFAHCLALATRVFGSRDDAEKWLITPAVGLNGERPIDLLTTAPGTRLVESYLIRMDYGVYT